MATEPDLVDRAARLFTFLAKAQQLKQKAVRDLGAYRDPGSVTLFADLPERPEVFWRPSPESDGTLVLSIERIRLPLPPAVPESLRLWIKGDSTTVQERPTLASERGVSGERLEDHPEVQALFDDWIAKWDGWADTIRRDRPLVDVYESLFKTYVQVTQKSEELELLLGVGLLSWAPESHERVRRHLFTVGLTPRLDERSGRLEFFIDEAASGLTSEFDMLDPTVIPDQKLVPETEVHAAEFSGHPLDPEHLGELASPVAVRLHQQGHWDDGLKAPDVRNHPVVAFAPALIVRPRTQAGLVRALTAIAEQIREREDVPAGLLPLLDPDRLPPVVENTAAGALLPDGDDIISPLPLNGVQRKILERVDSHAHTIVQGPPGTGKTHTAAALLTHLLAQGQRVLVTAHTDRALHEVRAKLPAPVRSLAVSVIGASRDDLADLRTAVDTIAQRSAEHDTDDAEMAIERELREVERLRQERFTFQRAVVTARGAEVVLHSHRGYEGTLAAIASEYEARAEQHGWLGELVQFTPGARAPVTNAAALQWLELVRDRSIVEDEPEASRRRLPSAELPEAEQFARLVGTERELLSDAERFEGLADDPRAQRYKGLPDAELRGLRDRLVQIRDRAESLRRGAEPWVADALGDVLSGNGSVWDRRRADISNGVDQVDAHLALVPLGTRVELGRDPDRIVALAGSMAEFFAAGGGVKTAADGSVKVGILSPGVVKECRDLFEQARVDGRPPSTLEAVQRLIAYRAAENVLTELMSLWPSDFGEPDDDNVRELVEWHRSRVLQLGEVLRLGEAVRAETSWLHSVGVEPPSWDDADQLLLEVRTVEAVLADRLVVEAQAPLKALSSRLEQVVSWPDAAECVEGLAKAVAQRDHVAYDAGLRRLRRLEQVTELVEERDRLTGILAFDVPALVGEVQQTAEDAHWDERLGSLEAAFDWGATGAWILQQDATDINSLQAKIGVVERKLTEASVRVATLRAWNHAVGPGRLTPARRADLRNYSQQVARLGKGTGKYAAQQRSEIRRAMDRCRPAVPVWIMPIYRIAEQLAMEENAFDVVIVDEASQAGLEATLLQYLAPKIVVIGDDKQVSPSAVGIEQQQLRDLATQYLYDDRYKDTWQDPKRSLFDEAAMRYGGQLTLLEHRRCVPEIIGYSNRIAYEPRGIRLEPVRQFGADRLDPFHVRFVPPVLGRGRSGVNEAEAEALVEDLKACLADPAFDGKSMAVISLVGGQQAKYIESLLLREIDASDWSERDLRVGIAPDFQGSERDVVFLSMVSIAEPGVRVASLTGDAYIQRFNVAVSRARDQIRLFHSIKLEELPNKEDMRHHLLDYAYGVVRRGRELAPGMSPVVPEDERVEPFGSLFEQRVYNRIVDRGFTVIPQSEQIGYFIDLIVVGASSKLAVECDGDFWHGPEAYEDDLRRQRELERCGWTFFRIRESVFYVDPAAALAPLWELLDERGISPADTAPKSDDEEPDQTGEPVDDDPDVEPTELEALPVFELEVEDEESEGATPDEVPARAVEDEWLGEPAFASIGEPSPNGHTAPASHPRRSLPVEAPDQTPAVLQPYETFEGHTIAVDEASRTEILNGLMHIVTVEGPMCRGRLKSAYVRASGGQRVGKAIAARLDSVIRSAVNSGKLVCSGSRRDKDTETLRLPDQSGAVLRELGPRTLDEVPIEELRLAMAAVMEQNPVDRHDFEVISRKTLRLLGRTSLTNAARTQLEPIYDYCLALAD